MLARNHLAATAAVRPKSITVLAACTIVACLSFASSASAQATGACCLGGLCAQGFTEAGCLANPNSFYFGDGSECSLGADECGACCDQNTGLCREVTSDTFDCVGTADTFFWNQQCPEITCVLPAVCGNNIREGTEECDGSDDAACPGQCQVDCTCGAPPGQVCGNNIREGTEQCDGPDDAACPGLCQANCTCGGPGAVCGDSIREGTEQCDGADADACPGLCQTDCTCAGEPIPTVSEWGMVILMLSLLVGFKLKFGRYAAPEAK